MNFLEDDVSHANKNSITCYHTIFELFFAFLNVRHRKTFSEYKMLANLNSVVSW